MPKKLKRIILGVTGSIAAYKAGDIIRRLKEKGFRVSVIMTRDAENFIAPLTLASLAEEDVYRSTFGQPGGEWKMPHIDLAGEADLVLVAPATANIIGKYAAGIADDLLGCVLLATRAPVVMAPAMNTQMYTHKIVEENRARLKKNGVCFIEPVKGKLACGTVGQGHIAETDDIVKRVLKLLK